MLLRLDGGDRVAEHASLFVERRMRIQDHDPFPAHSAEAAAAAGSTSEHARPYLDAEPFRQSPEVVEGVRVVHPSEPTPTCQPVGLAESALKITVCWALGLRVGESVVFVRTREAHRRWRERCSFPRGRLRAAGTMFLPREGQKNT